MPAGILGHLARFPSPFTAAFLETIVNGIERGGDIPMVDSERIFLKAAIRYYRILMRRKWLIACITGIATVSTLIFAFISIKLPPEKSPLPNTYSAEAILFVSQNEQSDISNSILSALGMNQPSAAATTFNNSDMILEILKSRTIIDRLSEELRIAQRYGIPEDDKITLRKVILGKFNFNYARNTGSLRLSFMDIDPFFARDVVNRMVQLLSDWFAQNRGLANEKTKQTLEQKLLEVKSDITSLQSRLKILQQRYGVLNAEELSASQAKSLADLRSQFIMKEIEIKNYSIYARIDDPRLEQLNAELQNLRDLISRSQTTVPDLNQDNARPRNISDVAQEFSQLTNELDIQQRIYNILSPQYEAAKLSSGTSPIFEIFELAEVPYIKTGPRRAQLVIKAFCGGLAFSIALALLLNLISEWKNEYLSMRSESKNDEEGP
jgi:tyrosine-protein kinase Etk/Wzc